MLGFKQDANPGLLGERRACDPPLFTALFHFGKYFAPHGRFNLSETGTTLHHRYLKPLCVSARRQRVPCASGLDMNDHNKTLISTNVVLPCITLQYPYFNRTLQHQYFS